MIVKSKGFEIGDFWIPPFELNEGELIHLCLFGGGHFFDLEMELVKIFTGFKAHSNFMIYQKMEFAERIKTNSLIHLIMPLTVGRYLDTNGKASVEEFRRAFDLDFISSMTKVNTLAGNSRKWLSLISALSKSTNVIFDLVGQDPLGAERTLDFIVGHIERGGSAILLDNSEDADIRYTKQLKIEFLK